jgi:hypothetical protein
MVSSELSQGIARSVTALDKSDGDVVRDVATKDVVGHPESEGPDTRFAPQSTRHSLHPFSTCHPSYLLRFFNGVLLRQRDKWMAQM